MGTENEQSTHEYMFVIVIQHANRISNVILMTTYDVTYLKIIAR